MRRAFTLIELLVVMTIIAILAGLLFPVFARAKSAAKDVQTISNAKQLGVAFELYIGDFDDIYPQSADGSNGAGQVGGWVFYSTFGNKVAGTFDVTRGVLFPYAKSKEIYKSPLDADSTKSGDSFAFNGAIAKWTGTGMNLGVASTSVENPAGQMMIGEEGCGEDQPFVYGYRNGTNDAYLNPAVDHFAKFHTGGAAIVFCDSHAKIMQAQDHFVETVCGSKVVCY